MPRRYEVDPQGPFFPDDTDFALFGPWRRTPAEIAASVTPINYAYSELTLSRYSSTGTTALAQAVLVAAQYTNATILNNFAFTLTSDVTIPASATLSFQTGAIITIASGVTLTINGWISASDRQLFDASAASARVTGLIKNPYLLAEWWGARGDGNGSGGGTDDSSAIQKCMKAAADAGFSEVRGLLKTYRCDTLIDLTGDSSGSIYCPTLRGLDMDHTIYDFTNVAPGASFRAKSTTSGHAINKDVLMLLRVLGNATSFAIEFQGICGAWARQCSFYTHSAAVLFNNEVAATFSEYNGGIDCYFASDCTNKVRYSRTSGDSSMHGSGVRGRETLFIGVAGTQFILINPGVQPYNAPIEAQFFGTTGASTAIQNNSSLSAIFGGWLSWECAAQVLTLGASGEILFSGTRTGSSQNATGGTFVHCQTAVVNTNGSTAALGVYRAYSQVMAAGGNTLVSRTANVSRTTRVEFVGQGALAGYHYEYIGLVSPIAGTTGAWTQLAFVDNVNAGGVGAPTFAVNSSGQLVATNASFTSNITCYWSDVGLGMSGQRQTV